jgi:putative tryptophan/tyrosine transport system substrate-binding protein
VGASGMPINRREALGAVLGLFMGAACRRDTPPAPKSALPVVGLLDAGERLEWWAAFRDELRDLGYVEDRDVVFATRFAGGKFERLPALAQELVRLKVAVIATGGVAAVQEARRATGEIPIVMATGDDPVKLGLVSSLSHPGGNVTGVTSLSAGLPGKRLEVLRTCLPGLSRLAVLWDRENVGSVPIMRELEQAARAADVRLEDAGVRSVADLPAAFASMSRKRAQAVFVIGSPRFFPERGRIVELAVAHKLPTMHGTPEYVQAGGLLSYSPSFPHLFKAAALYVDKILRGAKPAELPIGEPNRFVLAVNLKTAKSLELTMPRPLVLLADEVIE